jgi:fumarate reductase flavoprotein subunit
MALKVGADVRNAWRVIEELRFRPPYRKNVLTMLPPSRRLTQGMRIAVERAPGPIVGALAKYAFTGWVAPSRELFDHGAILVNARGERFTNEHENAARALADEPYNACYVLFDGVVADEFSAWPNPVSTFSGIGYAYLRDYKRIRPDVFHSGATLEELELKIGAPSGSLGATVARYNHAISDDREDQFGRGSRGRGLHRPPFFALGPAHGVVTITDGGLSVDDDCRVLRDGDPIPGLYAAGSAGQGGLILKAHGLHIAWAMTSGRVAAIAATLDS